MTRTQARDDRRKYLRSFLGTLARNARTEGRQDGSAAAFLAHYIVASVETTRRDLRILAEAGVIERGPRGWRLLTRRAEP